MNTRSILLLAICSLAQLLMSQSTIAGSFYHCKTAQGKTVFQDKPCKDKTVKTFTNNHSSNSSQGDLQPLINHSLAKLGKTQQDMANPQIKQQVYSFMVKEAEKSYTLSRKHSISTSHCRSCCGKALNAAYSEYKSSVFPWIQLGEHYLANGTLPGEPSQANTAQAQQRQATLNHTLSLVSKKYAGLSGSAMMLQRQCAQAAGELEVMTKYFTQHGR